MGISYMPDAVEVDVREYVKWLIRQPPMARIDEFSQTAAIEAARRLWLLAPSSSKPEAVQGLALSLADIAVRFGRGKEATTKGCRTLLGKVKPRIGTDQYKLGINVLNEVQPTFPADYLEYRAQDGRVMGVLRKGGKKSPDDDLSYRLAVAVHGLKESGCPKHFVVLAEILMEVTGKDWTAQKIESRINKNKIPVREEWPATIWKERFWRHLEHNDWQKPSPDKQPFILKWRG